MAVLRDEWSVLFELVGDLVEPGLGAGLILVAAGRPRHAGRADDVLADLDRQPAGGGADAGQPERGARRIVLLPLRELARGRAEGAGGERLALTVLDRVRRGIVAAQMDDDLAGAADHGDRDAIALSLAGFPGCGGDRQAGREPQVLVAEQLSACPVRARSPHAHPTHPLTPSHLLLPLPRPP